MEAFLTKGLKLPDSKRDRELSSSVVRLKCIRWSSMWRSEKRVEQEGFPLNAPLLVGVT